MKHLYESILGTDLESDIDDIVKYSDIKTLFFDDDSWGHIKSSKNDNLVLDVNSRDPREIQINKYLSTHKIKSIDFGQAEICIHHDGNGLKNIDLKAHYLNFRYNKHCELKNVHLICDQVVFCMSDAGVKLNKCVIDAEKIICIYTYINSIQSTINARNLTINIPEKNLRINNKLRQFIETIDLIEFKTGSYRFRSQAAMKQHEKLLVTIDPMDALGLSGKIDTITIKPAQWMPGIMMTKIKPSQNYFEMDNGWYIQTTD